MILVYNGINNDSGDMGFPNFLEFDSFFKDHTSWSDTKIVPMMEDVYVEMAEGGRAGGGRGGYIRLEEDDIQYLYQFLPEDWAKALQWRYGIGLMLYSKKKNDKGLGQSEDYTDHENGNIVFDTGWLHKHSPYLDDEIRDTPFSDHLFFENRSREYRGVKFGFNNTFKKLSDVSKYDFDMGNTNFSKWPELQPSNAGYKPLTRDSSAKSINKWLKATGMENHHPDNYQQLMNAHLAAHPEVEKDEMGQPTHPNYSQLDLHHHMPITKHNYNDYLYRRLGNQFTFPSRLTQWHVGTGYNAGVDPHQQQPHPQAGQETGNTHYRRTRYKPNLEKLQRHGELAPEIAKQIERGHDSDFFPLGKGEPVTMKVKGKDVQIQPDDVNSEEFDYIADIASRAVGKTINPQDVEVKPASETIFYGKGRGNQLEYDIYDMFGLHRSMMGRDRHIEHLFPEQVHQLAREIFVKTAESKKWYENPEKVFNSVYNQRYSTSPTYYVDPDDEKSKSLLQVDQDRIRSAYAEAGRRIPEEQLIEWDKTGLLKATKEHKAKISGNPDVELKTVLTSGFWQNYSLKDGPEIWERDKKDGKFKLVTGRKVFVPLLYPGQALPSQKQRGKSVAIGAIGNSAVGEQQAAFFGSDDQYTIPGTNKTVDRNKEFFSSALEGRLPDKRLFATLNRPSPEPEEIHRAHDFSYPELAKWQGKEMRHIGKAKEPEDFNDEGVKVNINGKDHIVLKSVVLGVEKALSSIRANNPILAETMENDIGNLYSWSMIILSNLIDHPQFWYNKDYEDYLHNQEEERSSGDVTVPSEQSDASLRETGTMWRMKKVRDYIKAYAQRRWGDLGTRRKKVQARTNQEVITEKGQSTLSQIAKDDHMVRLEEKRKREQGERKAPELLDSGKSTPANAQNSYFVAMEYRKWLKEQAEKGNYHDSEIIQMENRVSACILRALMMRAIHSINAKNPGERVVPSVREILQMPKEEGGFGLSKQESVELIETDPKYEQAIVQQERMAAIWAQQHASKEIAARERMDDPTGNTELLPKEFITKYADKPIDPHEIIQINSAHERTHGHRTTPFMNKAEEVSKATGDISEDDMPAYRAARNAFEKRNLSLTDTEQVDRLATAIAEAAGKDDDEGALVTMTAFRDHLLDDLAKNHYLRHHLEDTIDKIRESAGIVENEGIDPHFKKHVEERLAYAQRNDPKIRLHSNVKNKYKDDLKRLIDSVNPDERDNVEEVIKFVNKVPDAKIFNVETVANIIKEFSKHNEKREFSVTQKKSVPYVILDKIMNFVLKDTNSYLFTQSNQVNSQLKQIAELLEQVYGKNPDFSYKNITKRFELWGDIASYRSKQEVA